MDGAWLMVGFGQKGNKGSGQGRGDISVRQEAFWGGEKSRLGHYLRDESSQRVEEREREMNDR